MAAQIRSDDSHQLFSKATEMVAFFSQILNSVSVDSKIKSVSELFRFNSNIASTHGNNRYKMWLDQTFMGTAEELAEKMQVSNYFDIVLDMGDAFANGFDSSVKAGITNKSYNIAMDIVDLLEEMATKPDMESNNTAVLRAAAQIIQFNTGKSNKVAHIHQIAPDVEFDKQHVDCLVAMFATEPPTSFNDLIQRMVSFAATKFF